MPSQLLVEATRQFCEKKLFRDQELMALLMSGLFLFLWAQYSDTSVVTAFL